MTPKTLLWIDSGGGLLAGAGVLALRGWIAELHGLPVDVITFLGAANVAYGTFSGVLSVWTPPVRRGPTTALVIANFAWPLVCVGVCAAYAGAIGPTGVMHLIGEGLYVGGLAEVERRVLLRRSAPV